MRVLPDIGDRVAVRCPESLLDKQRHELASFARYCIRRVEYHLVAHDRWTVELTMSPGGWTCNALVDLPWSVGEARVEAYESSHAIRGAIERAAVAAIEIRMPLLRSA
jgi:hypothetical protein